MGKDKVDPAKKSQQEINAALFHAKAHRSLGNEVSAKHWDARAAELRRKFEVKGAHK